MPIKRITQAIKHINRLLNTIRTNTRLSFPARTRITKLLNIRKQKLEQIKTMLKKGNQVQTAELEQALADLQANKAEIKSFLSQYKNELSEVTKNNLEKSLREIDSTEKKATNSLNRRPDSTVNKSRATANQPPAPANMVNGNTNLLRSQLLNSISEIKIDPLNLTQTISLPRLFEALKQQPLAQALRTISTEVRSKRTPAVSEILGRLILSFVIDRLIKDLIKNTRQVGEITRENFKKAVEQINQDLKRTVVEVRTKEQAAVRREKEVVKPREKEVAARASKEAGRVIVEVAYDSKGNVLSLEVTGRVRETEVVRSAIRLIQINPEARVDIVRFVAQVFGRTTIAPEHVKVNDPTPVAVPTTQAENSFAAATGIASEPILVEIIRSLITEPKQVVNQQFAAARTEIAKAILQQAPQAALPVLLKEHTRLTANHPAKEAVAKMIVEVAKTVEGQKYVLNAFATDQAKPLISSKVGHKVIVQTVQNILAQAKAEQVTPKSAAATLKDKKGLEQLVAIGKMVASANYAKIPAEQVTVKSARAFLEFVAQTQKVVKLIGPKNLTRLEKQKAKPQKAASTAYGKTKTPRRRKVAQRSRTVRSRKALRALVKHAEDAKLLIPKHLFYIIGNHYAGMAGFTGIKDSRVAQPYLATERAPESRATSALRRVLAAMEVDLARAVSRNTQTLAKSAVSALSAEIMVYGLVMRRVKAAIEKADELIQALRKQGKLGRIIKLVAEGKLEEAIQQIDFELYQLDSNLLVIAA